MTELLYVLFAQGFLPDSRPTTCCMWNNSGHGGENPALPVVFGNTVTLAGPEALMETFMLM